MLNKTTPHFFKIIISFFVLLPAILLSSGCSLFGGGEKIDANDKTLSVVYGYFDMKDAPSWGGIDWVSIKQYKPKTLYYGCHVEEGLFFNIGIHKGSSIQVETFGRNTRWYSNARYTYNFGGQGRNKTGRVIKKTGVYYLGSYKYEGVDSGSIFKPDSFKMVEAKAPSEKELLKKVLEIMTNDPDYAPYTNQIGMIKTRLSQLK